MDFLVRAKLSGNEDLCKANIARYFVDKMELAERRVGWSKIGKVWDLYRDAAPYIYAFYPLLYGDNDDGSVLAQPEKLSEEDWIHRIAQLAEESTIEECLGHAAYAAKVMRDAGILRDTAARKFSEACFKEVQPRAPSLREFDDEELVVIDSCDAKAPIKD